MKVKIYVIETKRKGGGSYAPYSFHVTEKGAQKRLREIVDKYGDEGSYINENKIVVNIMGQVYYQITEYDLED